MSRQFLSALAHVLNSYGFVGNSAIGSILVPLLN
jgi:hypothetical protein